MIAVSMLQTNKSDDFQHLLSRNPSLSPSLRVKQNTVDNLIAYTAYNVKTLLHCSKERCYYQQRLLPSLPTFVKHIFHHCKLTPSIIVVALIYLERLKKCLPHQSKGEFDTPYKMFIASVILASKYVEDSNKMAHSIYKFISPLYHSKEINEMERSFLGVIKFDLYVNLSEVYDFVKAHHDTLELEIGLC